MSVHESSRIHESGPATAEQDLTIPPIPESISSDDSSPDVASPTTERLLPEDVSSALDQVAKRDTYDAVRRRVNGTSLLATRVTLGGGIPAFATGFLYNAYTFGPQTVAITVGSLLLVASVTCAAAYTGSRMRIGARLRKREAEQGVVRNHLGEPVDMIRTRKGVKLRWYGADEAYATAADETSPQESKTTAQKNAEPKSDLRIDQQGDRLRKVVAFANKAKAKSVIVSSRVIDLAPKENKSDVAVKYADKTTSTKEIFRKTKGARLNDRLGDEMLLEMTPHEATQLIEDLGLGENAKMEKLAKLLLTLDPKHRLKTYFENWQKYGKTPEMQASLRKVLRASFERAIDRDGDFTNTIGSRYEATRTITDPMTGEQTETLIDVKTHTSVNRYASVNGTSVRTSESATLPNDSLYAASHTTALTSYMGYESAEAIIKKYTRPDTDYALIISESAKKQASERGNRLIEADLTELELALYEQLHRMHDDKMPDIVSGGYADLNEEYLKTFYGRIAEERPRGFLRPWIAKRGAVSAAEQTVEYGRLHWRNLGKKVGALALATAIGGGAGYGLGKLWDESYFWDGGKRCYEYHGLDPKNDTEGLTDAQEQACLEVRPFYLETAGSVSDTIAEVNSDYENWFIMQMYKSGLLDEKTLFTLADSANSDWLVEKYNDLAGRYNVYGGRNTYTADALLSSNPEAIKESPAVWTLSPSEGVSVDGLWYSGVLDGVSISRSYGLTDTPPLIDGSIGFTDTANWLSSSDEYVSAYYGIVHEKVQVLNPSQELLSRSDTRTSIGIGGRHLVSKLDTVQYGPLAERAAYYYLPLPIRNDGSIVSSTFDIKTLLTDELLTSVPATVIQREDGTVAALLPFSAFEDFTRTEIYIETNYQIDLNQTSEKTIRATKPLTVYSDFHDVGDMKLTDVLSEEDVSELARSLKLPKNSPLQRVVTAIQSSHSYSYTPNRDSGQAQGTMDPGKMTVSEALTTVAEHANKYTSIHCSAAALIETVVTRGQEVDEGEVNFVNGVVGFRNNKDNKLTAHESHVFLTTDDGEIIDPTPLGTEQTPDMTPTEYEGGPSSGITDVGAVLKGAGLLLTVGALGAAGVKLTPRISTMTAGVRRRREERVLGILPDEDEVFRRQFRDDVGMLVRLYHEEEAYLKSAAEYADSSTRPNLRVDLSQTDPLLLLKNLPVIDRTTRVRFHDIIDAHVHGKTIEADQARRLRTILNRLADVKKRTEDTSVFANQN